MYVQTLFCCDTKFLIFYLDLIVVDYFLLTGIIYGQMASACTPHCKVRGENVLRWTIHIYLNEICYQFLIYTFFESANFFLQSPSIDKANL